MKTLSRGLRGRNNVSLGVAHLLFNIALVVPLGKAPNRKGSPMGSVPNAGVQILSGRSCPVAHFVCERRGVLATH